MPYFSILAITSDSVMCVGGEDFFGFALTFLKRESYIQLDSECDSVPDVVLLSDSEAIAEVIRLNLLPGHQSGETVVHYSTELRLERLATDVESEFAIHTHDTITYNS